jgi:hypothetical protein
LLKEACRSGDGEPTNRQHPDQREDRVPSHILVCFLAFVRWKSPKMWQSRAGLGNSPRTILEELARIQSQDVVLPIAAHDQIRLRCVTQPHAAQAALLNRPGIVLPNRMRLAEHDLPALELRLIPTKM